MERLTIPDKKIPGGTRRTIIDARAVREEAMTIYWALKKYEDTGLTPEGIERLKEQHRWIPVEERLPEDYRKAVRMMLFTAKCMGYHVEDTIRLRDEKTGRLWP